VVRLRRVAFARAQAGSAAAAIVFALLLAQCAVGPDYTPDAAPVPDKFKELKGWKVAFPSDGLDRGDWWLPYHDQKLSFLLQQVEISNQTVASAAAAYEEARSVIRESQASLFPQLTGSYSFNRMRSGPNANGTRLGQLPNPLGATYSTTYIPQASGTWDLDVWGKVRRQIESNTAAAQASSADLDNAKLSAQATLAVAYFNVRAADSLADLLMRTVAEYKRTLGIVENQFKAGYSVTNADVSTARAQVENAQSMLINVGVARAQNEHAIAVLIGRPPAELTIASHLLPGGVPRIPITVPSTLLERRPDIAAAERTMQEQNALIGVAVAGYFPEISLTGMIEFIGRKPLPFNVAHEVWALGASASQPLFDGGMISAQVDAARAVYWESVANYRQTVLTAFQQVEDNLAAIRLYQQQLIQQQAAIKDARTAVAVYLNQFQAGTAAFTAVVTAEIILLGYEESELTIRQNLFIASVDLIEALGGGWDATLLPTQSDLKKGFSLLPKLGSAPPPLVDPAAPVGVVVNPPIAAINTQ
jgi:NodT family efflux transporter outer membrane factor (OMF) lipoprotein